MKYYDTNLRLEKPEVNSGTVRFVALFTPEWNQKNANTFVFSIINYKISAMFKITRIYSDVKGDSQFEDVEIPLKESGIVGRLSDLIPAKGIIFREVEPTYDWNFHTAPQKQYIILLDGEIEIETSLGEKRIFKAGEILLVEDTTGKGHKTKNLLSIKRKSVFITLP